MKRKTPVVRELNWPMVVPQALVLLSSVALAFLLLRDKSALMLGAFIYLAYSYGIRHVLMKEHRAGIRAVLEDHHQDAIEHFKASYDFFSRHVWVDRWRSVVLMYPSGASIREMALVNVAFCQAQLGRTQEARASYSRAATEFQSPLATAALNLMGQPE
jgi:high-affinity nickel permease